MLQLEQSAYITAGLTSTGPTTCMSSGVRSTRHWLSPRPNALLQTVRHLILLASFMSPKCPAAPSYPGASNAHINLISSVDGGWIGVGNAWYALLQSQHPPGWFWSQKP